MVAKTFLVENDVSTTSLQSKCIVDDSANVSGEMPKRKLAALEKLDADLPNLQHKIRRDPIDFENQYRQYESFRQLFANAPASAPNSTVISLRDLIDFIAHVANCYPDITAGFAQDLINLILNNHGELEPELREKIVGSLVLLQKKEVLAPTILLNTFFPLLTTTPSKSLRTLIYSKIISTLRNSNARTTNHKLNRSVQNTLYNLITADPTSPNGIWAVRITRELWRRRVWQDATAVDIMKQAALSQNTKVILGGVNFFSGGDKEREEDDEGDSNDEQAIDMGRLRHQAGVNKKGKKDRQLKHAAATIKRRERKKKQPHPLNFSALHLLNDAQSFAEALFTRHLQQSGGSNATGKSRLKLDQKLQVLQLVSRLVGLHKLTLLPLYSYFLKFLVPRQASVTSFLAYLAQATHNLVPPDVLEPCVQKIANEFVSEASASAVAGSGLNAIREICARQPLAISEVLLQDLVQFRKSKDKGVVMAARGLLSLYRDVGPELLRRRDRGRDGAVGLRDGLKGNARFGTEASNENGVGIEGLDLLKQWKDEEKRKKVEAVSGSEHDSKLSGNEILNMDDDDDEAAWIVQSDNDSDDSGGWIDVSSDEEDGKLMEQEERNKKRKLAKPKLRASSGVKDSKANVDDKNNANLDILASNEDHVVVDDDTDEEEEEDEGEEGPVESEEVEEDSDIEEAKLDDGETEELLSSNHSTGSDTDDYEQASTQEIEECLVVANQSAVEAADELDELVKFATNHILTPADLAKLNELRTSAAVQAILPNGKNRTHKKHHPGKDQRTQSSRVPASIDAAPVTSTDIELPSKLSHKATKEEKIAAAHANRDGDDRHLGRDARRKERRRDQGKSSTNREKQRGKNFLMRELGKRSSSKRGLVSMQKGLRGKQANKGGKKKGQRR